LKLTHIRNVIAVVERGSLRGGARQLGIAQPAMSRSIRELEQELGTELFERSTTGLTATPAGELFLQRARAIQAEVDRTYDEIIQFTGGTLGSLTVGFSTASHLAILSRILEPFRQRFPDVRVKVIEGLFPELEHDIRDGLIDLYFGPVLSDKSDSSLIVDKLFDNRRTIVARPDHPLIDATSLTELVGTSWITTPVMVEAEGEVNTMFEVAGLPHPKIAFQAGSGLSILMIISSSDLLAPVPYQWVEFGARTGLLGQIKVKELSYAPAICSVRRAGLPLTPAAEHFNDLAMRASANYAAKLPF
jgi:LysR family transcriptional regulator of abg operon